MRQRRFTPSPLLGLLTLLLTSLILIVADAFVNVGILKTLRTQSINLVTPFQELTFSLTSPVQNFLTDIGELGSKNETIQTLKDENDELRRTILGIEDIRRRLNDMNSLLSLSAKGQFTILGSRTISIGSESGYGSTITIDVGSLDGIKPSMVVVSGSGVVGRVVSVSSTSSIVMLICDVKSQVGARLEASGEVGVISGFGLNQPLEFRLLDPLGKLTKNSKLLTYGVENGVFNPGLPIGYISSIRNIPGTSSKIAQVIPYVDFSKLDYVGVIVKKPRLDPRDSLLPSVIPIPTVTVTVTAVPVPSPTQSQGGN
jgi:rod shape-determining protein MreC